MQCYICQNKKISQMDGHEYKAIGGIYRLYECACCGAAFTMPLPSDSILEQFYNDSFNYDWYRDHYSAKLKDCRMRVQEYRELLGNKVLDYGGGMGYFAKAVTESGREAITYDPYAANISLGVTKWDSVVSLHALEHSNNLNSTIQNMKNHLKPGGNIILAVPNYSGLGYRTMGMGWVWAQPPILHLFHFTAQSLIVLLEKHGFINIRVSYHDRWDANTYCDIGNVDKTRAMDGQWGNGPLTKYSIYRKYVAWRNARYRFDGLNKSLSARPESPDQLAELQISAVMG